MKMGLWWIAALAIGLVACGGAEQGAAPADEDPEAKAVGDGLEVTAAWSRAIPPNAPVAAGFMSIRNGGGLDDRLLSVRSDAAERVEIHEVRHEDGVARMRELADGLALPVGESVELAPGGYHLMFIAPGDGFVAGGRVAATLVFEHAGEVDVEFEVRSVAAPGGDGEHHH